MKQSEKYVENAIRTLHDTLQRNITDINVVLDMFEADHKEFEVCNSRQYNALLAGWFAIQEAVEKMNYQLNKK